LQNLCARFTHQTKLKGGWVVHSNKSFVHFRYLNALLLSEELGNKFIVPFVGTGDLLGWLELAEGTVLVVGEVTLGPLAETGGDLLDTTDWVGFVVTAEVGVNVQATVSLTAFAVLLGATVLVVLVIVSASFEASLETGNVVGELVRPVTGSLLGQIVVAPLLGETAQFVQALKWVTWWDLLVVGGGGGNEGKGESFHFW